MLLEILLLGEELGEILLLTEPEGDTEADGEIDLLSEGLTLAEILGETLGLILLDTLKLGDIEAEGLRLLLMLADGETLLDGLILGLTE